MSVRVWWYYQDPSVCEQQTVAAFLAIMAIILYSSIQSIVACCCIPQPGSRWSVIMLSSLLPHLPQHCVGSVSSPSPQNFDSWLRSDDYPIINVKIDTCKWSWWSQNWNLTMNTIIRTLESFQARLTFVQRWEEECILPFLVRCFSLPHGCS